MTLVQKKIYRAVLEAKRDVLVAGIADAPLPSLLNVQCELRKCCDHPFLIKGVEASLTKGMDNEQVNLGRLSSLHSCLRCAPRAWAAELLPPVAHAAGAGSNARRVWQARPSGQAARKAQGRGSPCPDFQPICDNAPSACGLPPGSQIHVRATRWLNHRGCSPDGNRQFLPARLRRVCILVVYARRRRRHQPYGRRYLHPC